MRSANDRKLDDLGRAPMGIRLQGGQRALAAYLATCKHDWQTSNERDMRVGRGCGNDLDTPTDGVADTRKDNQEAVRPGIKSKPIPDWPSSMSCILQVSGLLI